MTDLYSVLICLYCRLKIYTTHFNSFILSCLANWDIHIKISEKIDFYSGIRKLILRQMTFRGKVPQAQFWRRRGYW